MFKRLKTLLRRIQNSDEAIKKRWLVGATAISMILIIGLWLGYVNSTIKSAGDDDQNRESSIGFWQVFRNGLSVIYKSIYESIKESVKSIILEITKSRTIIIE
jgi:hypothetical protein